MNELITQQVRALLYGVVIGTILNCIVSLLSCYRKQNSDRARLVVKISIISNISLLLQYVLWFFIDGMDIMSKSWWEEYKLSGLLNFIEMSTIPFFISSIAALTRLRNTTLREVFLLLVPFAVLALIFYITDSDIPIFIGLGITVVFTAATIINTHKNVRYYKQLLVSTYANTVPRDISWVMSVFYFTLLIFVAWTAIAIFSASVLNDCIYMVLMICASSHFVHQLCNHNLDVRVMIDIDAHPDSDEESTQSDTTATEPAEVTPTPPVTPEEPETPEAPEEKTAELPDTDPSHESTLVQVAHMVAEVPLPKVQVKLKAWQEPKFGEAVRNFCAQEDVFTNPDLSVQDVATGVGSNRTYVSRWCKENEKDFSTFITRIRLDHAEKLIAGSNQPINEIAEDSGFSNTRHFRTVFTARYGCTPSEYRAQVKANG